MTEKAPNPGADFDERNPGMDCRGFRACQAVQGGLSRAVQGVEADWPPAGRGAEGPYRVPPRRRCRRGRGGDRRGFERHVEKVLRDALAKGELWTRSKLPDKGADCRNWLRRHAVR